MIPDAQTVPLGVLSTLLFTLMGPIAVIPRFAAITAREERAHVVRLALVAAKAAATAVVIAVLLGTGTLERFGISRPSLIVAAGVILTLTALKGIVLDAPPPPSADAISSPVPLTLGVAPLAVPGLVTPVGVCVLIIFVSYFPAVEAKLQVLGAALGIIGLDLIAMLGASAFMRRVGMTPLVILGAVFGVLQVALGVEMIVSGVSKIVHG